MTIHFHRWLGAMTLVSLVAFTVGCSSRARFSAAGDPVSGRPPARSRASAPLYIIPQDSLLTLAEGTPVAVALRTGARVSGTSLRPHPNAPDEFRVRALAREMFAHRDTVQIPITGIEVAVSSAPVAGGSEVYTGSRRLGPLPLPGQAVADPIRPTIIVLTIVAIAGAFALFGLLVVPPH